MRGSPSFSCALSLAPVPFGVPGPSMDAVPPPLLAPGPGSAPSELTVAFLLSTVRSSTIDWFPAASSITTWTWCEPSGSSAVFRLYVRPPTDVLHGTW